MMSIHKISIHYHPQDGVVWAKYLQSKLAQPEYKIGIALNDITSDDMSRGRSRLNIFLITPDFLELIDSNIVKGFDHQISLAILMGVDTENFTLTTTLSGVYEDVKDWLTLDVDGSEESVRHLLMTIVTMYEYDMLPSRIRPIFKEVIDEGMNVYIGLEKKAESDVSVQFDGKDEELQATFTNRYFYTFSLTDDEARMFSTFSVMCKEHILGKGQINDLVPSPHQVSTPECSLCTGHASSAVDGKHTKLMQLWELLKEETDPVTLLCQCMGLRSSDRKHLDKKLAGTMSVSGFPEHLSLINIDENLPQVQRDEKWPTLLHFAAEYNLMSFAEALLSYPALTDACKIRNVDGLTPDEIAHHSGHQELSELLKLFSHIGIPRWSNDSGFGDKVRLSQIKSYADKVGLSEGSQICPPPPAPHVGSNDRAVGYARPPKPRPVQVMDNPSLEETDGRLDRSSANDLDTEEGKGEQNGESFKDKLEDATETIHRPEDMQETCIKLQSDHLVTEEILFVANPKSKEELQQSTLTEERMAFECVSDQKYDIRESPKAKEKKTGFFWKLLLRKHKPKERNRTVSDGILDSVRKFQRKNANVRRIQTQREVPFERESGISRSSSSDSYITENEQEKAMPAVHEDTKSKKKLRIFFRNAETRQSLRLAHAMRDKNISYPSLPSKKQDIL
ncbi:hypothetical protein CHS0354_019837 [Potamilus streckersoni]|uniref:DBB domain-containing protein n=1 Tax=Potamilus streckersoni TaxID=2493646 RepID=A0AAE0W3L0_9BIVA|nr:hypothetical protein CHS0354_019837 [Potamilus streckersoni]